jgi:enamine deaminase RidA (YjgF/YER057c/UK114 family)
MELTPINAETAPRPQAGYAQALAVEGAQRLLFISGQIPQTADGHVPADFVAQAELAWANVLAQLQAADMGFGNLVKVTTFLSSREYGLPNREVRARVLAGHTPALTVIITGIFDEQWLLEIEAIAAA